jgi:L-seryl-tRNA(Ser) seleniumtransferase
MPEQSKNDNDPRRNLASVSALLEQPAIERMAREFSRDETLEAIHETLDHFRSTLKPGDSAPDIDATVAAVGDRMAVKMLDRLRPVVNATGIILHTGLGRAVLPQPAVDALAGLNRCVNLQIDLTTGERGKRNYMTEQLLCRLTGAEAAMITNNNAAATLLILAEFCAGKEVIISRGQLIEIGGSFRLPDCIHQSGATMVEVGTTNKTHLRDYEAAITEKTGAILRVNPSNYRIVGFSKEVPIAELVELKRIKDICVIDDLGCGALVNLEDYGLPKEPTVQDSIAAGADIACFSGDKLIGGPQAGIIVGKKDLIQRLKKNPLSRMLRVGKLTDLALEQTLRLFLEPEKLIETNPTLRMLALPAVEMKKMATKLKRRIDKLGLPLSIRVEEGESATGGGSLPAYPVKTYVLAVSSDAHSPDQINACLRANEPPIIARVKNDETLLDMRTLMDGDDEIIVKAMKRF